MSKRRRRLWNWEKINSFFWEKKKFKRRKISSSFLVLVFYFQFPVSFGRTRILPRILSSRRKTKKKKKEILAVFFLSPAIKKFHFTNLYWSLSVCVCVLWSENIIIFFPGLKYSFITTNQPIIIIIIIQ